MFASKIVMAAIALGAVSFAAPVEKREAQVLAPPPAMLGPLGLKSIVPSSTIIDAQAAVSTAAGVVNSVVPSVAASNIVSVPTTLVSAANTKLASQAPASSSSQAANPQATSADAASSQATGTVKVTIKTKSAKVAKKTTSAAAAAAAAATTSA